MALPSSGQLSLKDIGVELGITAGNQASLRSMSSTAGFSTPDSVSEFYNYSAGDDITASYGTVTTQTDTTTTYQAYRTVTLSGLTSGNYINPQIQVRTTVWPASGTRSARFYWSINNSVTFNLFQTFTSGGQSANYYIPITGNVDPGETLRIRMYLYKSAGGTMGAYMDLLANYTGSGIGSYTRSSPYTWSVLT